MDSALHWTQYATVPQGINPVIMALSPTGGQDLFMNVPMKRSSETTTTSPHYLIGFYADTPGRHMLSFVLADQRAIRW